MIKKSVKIDEVIELLNTMLKLDSEALHNLVNSRVDCNEALAYHPTIQVRPTKETYQVGLVGVLNGLFGVDERGYGGIATIITQEGTILEFVRTDKKNDDIPVANFHNKNNK